MCDEFYSKLFSELMPSSDYLNAHSGAEREKRITEAILTLAPHENDIHRQLGLGVTPACEPISGLTCV